MEIKNYKKAFAFSFLAIFISFLIFGFSFLYLYDKNYSQNNVFKDSRINNLNNELTYFKDIYSVNVISFSLQNILHSILENRTILISLDKNYSKLNLLVKEALLNGTFYGVPQNNLENKTLDFFLNKFQNSFNNNQKGNFFYELIEINIYEKNPFYITAQIDGIYNITTADNITAWNFRDSMSISFPVFNLNDPEFILQANITDYLIRPAEDYVSKPEWTLETFIENLENGYSSIYSEPTYDYPIGTSFLNRLLNVTPTPYANLIAFFNFEKDEIHRAVYDSSLVNINGKHFGNSYLLLNFDGTTIIDLSGYNHTIQVSSGMNCSVSGVFDNGCYFNGTNDNITIPNSDFNLNFTNKVSISAWVKPHQYVDVFSGKGSEIFRYGGNIRNQIAFRLSPERKLNFAIGSHENGTNYTFQSLENITLNEWSHLVGTFDGDTGIGKIYINGRISNIFEGDFEVSSTLDRFNFSNTRIGIGNIGIPGQMERFNGTMDEIAVYTKALSDAEVGQLFEKKRVQYIDYKDTYHGRGIEFDGEDDYIELNITNNSQSLANETFSMEIWFKPEVDEANLLIWDRELALAYDSTQIYLRDNRGNGITANYPLKMGQYYYLLAMKDKSREWLYLYLNGNLLISGNSTTVGWDPEADGGKFTMGSDSIPNAGPVGESFKGIIDEFRFSDRIFTPKEISRNYYNYDSETKGCCNYITLISPNIMNFNRSPYNTTLTSYSSKAFFDRHNANKFFNVTLYNITNITSHSNALNYTNFLADICILEAYSVFSFNHTIDPALEENVGQYNFTCSNLILNGIY
ncbi:MAG: laminin G domain-containing protein [Nanoarchaeota archaeon]|nr:laminin G domain-containing protein [Nanoarchaeota archaeon]